MPVDLFLLGHEAVELGKDPDQVSLYVLNDASRAVLVPSLPQKLVREFALYGLQAATRKRREGPRVALVDGESVVLAVAQLGWKQVLTLVDLLLSLVPGKHGNFSQEFKIPIEELHDLISELALNTTFRHLRNLRTGPSLLLASWVSECAGRVSR